MTRSDGGQLVDCATTGNGTCLTESGALADRVPQNAKLRKSYGKLAKMFQFKDPIQT